ncbi:hypothetical protein KCP76_01700 [Salmonella enterica subsp. enterica serovar Weltevreden]|nr:hypothetical protein KCP76_01700 [Salmonella enterica subsp. enterica serovar Weltevreden]
MVKIRCPGYHARLCRAPYWTPCRAVERRLRARARFRTPFEAQQVVVTSKCRRPTQRLEQIGLSALAAGFLF